MTSWDEVGVSVPSPLVELRDERAERQGVRLFLKRDDLIHPALRGNKWRKLNRNLQAARDQGFTRLLTFGGAYSNHIAATAAAGRMYGFETVGVIRGEQRLPLNEVLTFAVGCGMTLAYLDRATYRRKREDSVIARYRRQFGDFYPIPEGGSNSLAVRGCAELVAEIDEDFDIICCACGTGGTLAGVAAGLADHQTAIGFSALKGGEFLVGEVERLQVEAFGRAGANWSVETSFHFGGFAKRNAELDGFISEFRERHGIELEWVYVAKVLYGVFALVSQGRFAAGTRLVVVLTG